MIMVVSLMAQGMVDLNSAGTAELEMLYRVGPKLAAKIIAEREKNGPFVSLGDVVVRVKGVGPKMIERWEGMAVIPPVAE
jgi:competence protein ComEA